MRLLEWIPEFSVGNASIDHEHKELIQAINDLYEQLVEPLNTEKIDAVLGEIHADISAHFALEELMMRASGYVEYEDHKRDHEKLLDQILDLMHGFYNDPEAGRKILKVQLSDWFGRHFASFDARLHQQLD